MAMSHAALVGARSLGYSPGTETSAVRDCIKAWNFKPLSALPKGLVLGSIDTGPYILLATQHSIVGAGYYREQEARGVQTVFDIFLSEPDLAGIRLLERGVDYVVFCPNDSEYSGYAAEAPDGLAATLGKGEVPPYLRLVPMNDLTALVYRFDQTGLK